MSTILKALKKLEQDKQAYQTGGMPAGYMGPGSAQAQPPRHFRRPRALLIVLIVFTLGGGAGYFYLRSPDTNTQTPNPIVARNKPLPSPAEPNKARAAKAPKSKALVPPQASAPAERPAAPISEAPKKTSTASKAPLVDSRSGKLSVQSSSMANPGRDSTAEQTSSQRLPPKALPQPKKIINAQPLPGKPALTPTMAGEQPRDKALGAEKPVRQAKPPAAPKPEAVAETAVEPGDAYNDVAPLTDGRLKVQAIAWSSIAEDRMAVINTRILHEGDKVDDFLVVSIRHDDVVVREKGVLYRVIFGRP